MRGKKFSWEKRDFSSHHGHISLEDLLDELVLGGVDEMDDVSVEAVSVFLQESWGKKTASEEQKIKTRDVR